VVVSSLYTLVGVGDIDLVTAEGTHGPFVAHFAHKAHIHRAAALLAA
jgi:hypothetical protein